MIFRCKGREGTNTENESFHETSNVNGVITVNFAPSVYQVVKEYSVPIFQNL
jgi:hypothetical protein